MGNIFEKIETFEKTDDLIGYVEALPNSKKMRVWQEVWEQFFASVLELDLILSWLSAIDRFSHDQYLYVDRYDSAYHVLALSVFANLSIKELESMENFND